MSRTETKNADKDLCWGFWKKLISYIWKKTLHLKKPFSEKHSKAASEYFIVMFHENNLLKEFSAFTIVGKYSIECDMG